MTCKGFRVHLHLELHAITCPGVWLCPNGQIALRITTLGSTLESHRVSPIFPLLFHNQFNFKKTFTRVAALTELQRNFDRDSLYAELIQWVSPQQQPILLATFDASLTDVLYPPTHDKRVLAGVDVDLLMDPSKYFPGIIAPKIEISTKTVIEDVATVCDESPSYAYVDSKMIDPKQKTTAPRTRPAKGITRQRKVCHARSSTAGRTESGDRTGRYADECTPMQTTILRCFRRPGPRCESSCCNANLCGQAAQLPRIDRVRCHPTNEKAKCSSDHNGLSMAKRQISSLCGDSRVFDNCPVCFKYKCYFPRENPDSHDYGRCSSGSRPRSISCRDSQTRTHRCLEK